MKSPRPAIAARKRRGGRRSVRAAIEQAEQRPDHVSAQIAAAYACDAFGTPAQAIHYYERARRLGVPAAQRREFLLGYGSTLRNVGRVEEAIRVLRRGARAYPKDTAFLVFLALALHSQTKHTAALAVLLQVIVRLDRCDDSLRLYHRALTHYGRLLEQAARKSPSSPRHAGRAAERTRR